MRFIDNKDGTIIDTQTELMWQQSDDGIKRNWEEAKEYAKDLSLADFEDWRLPTVEELFLLADRTKYDPAINCIFQCRSDYYWSSSTHADYPDHAWSVYFYGGYAGWYDKTYYGYVRCVRAIMKRSL